MKPTAGPHALFYPFHLCHQETLGRLLLRFRTVHFRDFMALQLTPLAGMTAFPDRMGDSNPELVRSGRIVQGHDVSGPLPRDVAAAADRDLDDPVWRALFHSALNADSRFQRGLFQGELDMHLTESRLESAPYSLERVRKLLARTGKSGSVIDLDYGLALLKTSAALAYTARLAYIHGLQATTDSAVHFKLFDRSCLREGRVIPNHLVLRQGY